MAFSKSVNFTNAQTAVPCNVCEDEAPGEYYCIECKQTLCPQCEKNHRRVAATKNHNIVLRTQIGDLDTMTLTCSDHGDQASFHCEKCNIPVCGKCITKKHRGHELSQLDDVFDREKKVLQNNVTKMKEILSKLKKERGEMINEKQKYDSKMQRIRDDLEAEKKDAMKELQRIYDDKTKGLASIQRNNSTLFDDFNSKIIKKIEILDERITVYHETIRMNSLPTVIKLARRKLALPEIGCKPKIPKPPHFAPGEIQDLEKVLGKLQFSSFSAIGKQGGEPSELITLTIVSKFKFPLQGEPCICITKEGDVWLGGNKYRELVMVDIKGQVLRRRNIQNRPEALAVMDCGDVIISPHGDDSTTVSRLLRDGREKHVYDTSPSCSTGVSVTTDQKILICTFDGRVVQTNYDGTNIKQIYKGSGLCSISHAIENADGYIYISDLLARTVLVVKKDGTVMSTIKQPKGGHQMIMPIGLVLDKMGNILCSDEERDVVYIIKQKRRMKELMGRSFGLQDPRWLAVDNDNNLWIAQSDGIVLVVKYLE